ncbi:MAG: hypothetical protein ACPG7R_09600, partial [Planctomycetota bacterium]
MAKYTAEAKSGEIHDLAQAMAVELTVEVPEKVIDRYPHLHEELVAKVESIDSISSNLFEIVLSFSGDLP